MLLFTHSSAFYYGAAGIAIPTTAYFILWPDLTYLML